MTNLEVKRKEQQEKEEEEERSLKEVQGEERNKEEKSQEELQISTFNTTVVDEKGDEEEFLNLENEGRKGKDQQEEDDKNKKSRWIEFWGAARQRNVSLTESTPINKKSGLRKNNTEKELKRKKETPVRKKIVKKKEAELKQLNVKDMISKIEKTNPKKEPIQTEKLNKVREIVRKMESKTEQVDGVRKLKAGDRDSSEDRLRKMMKTRLWDTTVPTTECDKKKH